VYPSEQQVQQQMLYTKPTGAKTFASVLDTALRYRAFRLDFVLKRSVSPRELFRNECMASARKKLDPSGVIAEIDRLRSLNADELRIAWRKAFIGEGVGLSRGILFRVLAWKIQEAAFGGYDRITQKALSQYADTEGNLGGNGSNRRVQTGAVLVREYQGARHTVTVVQDGFIWQEKIYSNLTRIAREITGVNWNGPRFFGLRQAKKNTAFVAEGQA
jgi:hypothetical protein